MDERLDKFHSYILKKFGIVGKIKVSLSCMFCLEFYISEKIYIMVLLTNTDMIIWKHIENDNGTNIVPIRQDEKHNIPYFVQFEKYNDETERLKILKYIDKIKVLYLYTDYLDNLPLAYTFILSSPFCRDITKLIAHKILFFYFFIFIFFYFLLYLKNINFTLSVCTLK